MPFLLIRNDITKVQADVIVNPANEKLLEGRGTSRGIYLAAGEEKLTKACRKIGSCEVGNAVITPAFELDAKYIIHAVGPAWIDGAHGEEETLYRAYWNSMRLAVKYRLKSIAFPLLSAGNYGYPKDLALKTAIRAINDFLMEKELRVYLVLYDSESFAVSKKLFASVEEYIDDHYVEENDESFFQTQTFAMPSMAQASSMAPNMPSVQDATSVPARKLAQLMNRQSETFSQMLLRMIDERGLKDSQVYKKANVDRRHFSKIRKDKNYAPNKKTVLAFAIALELSMDETKDLLMRAGFAFSCCSKFDVIVSYFIENRIYDIYEINEMLFTYDQPILGE